MLETNVNNFSEGNKNHTDLKIKTKVNYTREEIKDNAIRIFSVQSKALKVRKEKLKDKFNYELK